jgi:hypothetical protein
MDLYKPYNIKAGLKIEAVCGMIFEENCGLSLLEDDRIDQTVHQQINKVCKVLILNKAVE